jgi:periplasmic protein TonB
MTNRLGTTILAGLLVMGNPGCATTSSRTPAQPSAPTAETTQQNDRPPALLRQTRPSYPPRAFYRGIEGTVELEILIDKTGRVVKTRIMKSIPELDAAAVQCVMEWKFRPAEIAGQPVATLASAPITFRITDKKTPSSP